MQRVLTGIQSSGVPHLGNLLGAILPAIAFSEHTEKSCLYFIADLHSLTTVQRGKERQAYALAVAAAWLACGLNTHRHLLYRQSRVPQVCELNWYLSCFTPYPMLANAHAFKERSHHLSEVNAGLFVYPVLMAADILLYQAEEVPVGPDQRQHLEITRDIATSFNHQHKDTFIIPKAVLPPGNTEAILGTDGRKMSKSYHNTLDIFLPKEQLRKQVMRIRTDSLPLEAPKAPDKCLVYRLYALLATEAEAKEMHKSYLAGGYGYGSAKEALYELLLRRFATEREKYEQYLAAPEEVEKQLQFGETRATQIAEKTLNKVRHALGFG